MTVPVLLLTGPTGVGKSAVLAAASSLLSEAGVCHAAVTLSQVGRLYPAPADDHWNERIAHRNLQSAWENKDVITLAVADLETRARGLPPPRP